jgi:putative NADH-flavin reductase
MIITVFGSTGGTGKQFVRQALAADHDVIAVARRPEALDITHPRLTVVQGDVLDPSWDGSGVEGADAVISALGAHPMRPPTTVYSQGITAVTAAMEKHGIARIIAVSASPLAPDSGKAAMERRVIEPILYRFFGGGYADMRRMEEILAESQLSWTVFRPARLTNGRGKGRYRTAVDNPLKRGSSTSRADLAEAMLAAIDNTTLYRHAVTIAK